MFYRPARGNPIPVSALTPRVHPRRALERQTLFQLTYNDIIKDVQQEFVRGIPRIIITSSEGTIFELPCIKNTDKPAPIDENLVHRGDETVCHVCKAPTDKPAKHEFNRCQECDLQEAHHRLLPVREILMNRESDLNKLRQRMESYKMALYLIRAQKPAWPSDRPPGPDELRGHAKYIQVYEAFNKQECAVMEEGRKLRTMCYEAWETYFGYWGVPTHEKLFVGNFAFLRLNWCKNPVLPLTFIQITSGKKAWADVLEPIKKKQKDAALVWELSSSPSSSDEEGEKELEKIDDERKKPAAAAARVSRHWDTFRRLIL